MNLHDVIRINTDQNNAAILLDQGISDNSLVGSYMPTQSAIQVFKHVCKAVLPEATQEQRALNLYGSYGSGKSHLAVVLAQLLRDGASSDGFNTLADRIKHTGNESLASSLQTTFLPKESEDTKPYLLVSLYASGTTSLGDKLMEGLYDALQREENLDIKQILSSTEYEVCVKRFEEMLEGDVAFVDADLSQWGIDSYFTTTELMLALRGHEPLGLESFLQWHKNVCHGSAFNVAQAGGKNFIEAYLEAGKNLSEKYGYGGIVVLWDEFGNALEELIGNPARNAGQEIISLQHFVETCCAPDVGHTLFFGVSHVSFPEYASRTNASDTIKDGLEKISGRFNKPFKVELNAAESDGYHLLGMQKIWSEEGRKLLAGSQSEKAKLIEACQRLPLFHTLSAELEPLFEDVYPLHPLMAVGLFNFSKLAQANRTALTFFRENAGDILNTELTDGVLWQAELIRFPRLLHYYAESLKKESGSDWRRYEQALASVSGDVHEVSIRKDILSTLLLAQLLGESFKASEDFLACALYDALPNTAASSELNDHLAWLKAAGVIWKNTANHFWSLAGEGGVDIDALIEKGTKAFSGRSYQYLFESYPQMQQDLLPTLGMHDLEPSSCGIIRSFSVEVLTPPFAVEDIKLKDPLISARVFLLLAPLQQDVLTAKARVQEMASQNIYFWMPVQGIEVQTYTENGVSYHLNDLLCRYLAIADQLKQGTALSEDLRRQLEAKGESNRNAIKVMLQVLYGRTGLESAQCKVFKSGSTEPVDCHSWHGFKSYLEQEVNQLYSHELPIRAMNMNVLRDEKYSGSSKLVKIVERILEFDENPAYQTDLLGDAKETSEQSALIDGILGANSLFVQQASGWGIKSADDTQEELREVLKLLHDTLLRKRENPYTVSELRNKLIAPPYGLPACTLPLFAAVAIRSEVKRLRWGSQKKDSEFAKTLVDAFTKGSKLTVQLFEFGKKQSAILFLVGHSLKVDNSDELPIEEYAPLCASALNDFIKNKADGVKRSNELGLKTQSLVKFIEERGNTPQDLADFLIELLDVKRDLPAENVPKIMAAIKSIFDDFSRVEDVKLHEISVCWVDVFPDNSEERHAIISRLQSINTHQSNQLSRLLESAEVADDVSPMAVIHQLLGKKFSDCSDSDIGRCTGVLESLFEQARMPEPERREPAKDSAQPFIKDQADYGHSSSFTDIFPGAAVQIDEPKPIDELKHQVNRALQQSGLTNQDIVNLLESLLQDRKG